MVRVYSWVGEGKVKAMKKNMNRTHKIVEMKYSLTTKYHGPLATGCTDGIEWIILDLGTHPCTYLNVEGTKYENIHYDEIPLSVHGGLTFNGKLDCHPNAVWIGWDYAHCGDYNPRLTSLGGHKWTTDELIKEAEEAAKKFAILLKSDNRPVIYNKISDTITEEIKLDGKTTVYDDLGNEEEMYALIEKSYKLNVPLAPVCQEQKFDSLKKAQEMEYRLNMMRYNISKCFKAIGFGWTNTEPAVILCYPNTDKVDLYWFEKSDSNTLWAERFSTLGAAVDYIVNHYGELEYQRWLTVNSGQSTNKKVLSISDWLLKR